MDKYELHVKPCKRVLTPEDPLWEATERRYYRDRQQAHCRGWLALYQYLAARDLGLAAVNADKAREAHRQLRKLEEAS